MCIHVTHTNPHISEWDRTCVADSDQETTFLIAEHSQSQSSVLFCITFFSTVSSLQENHEPCYKVNNVFPFTFSSSGHTTASTTRLHTHTPRELCNLSLAHTHTIFTTDTHTIYTAAYNINVHANNFHCYYKGLSPSTCFTVWCKWPPDYVIMHYFHQLLNWNKATCC
jgi:hypothetical protein